MSFYSSVPGVCTVRTCWDPVFPTWRADWYTDSSRSFISGSFLQSLLVTAAGKVDQLTGAVGTEPNVCSHALLEGGEQ